MKILQISNKGIFPPDGGTLAIINLSKGLIQNECDVSLFTLETEKHCSPSHAIPDEIKEKLLVIKFKISTKLSFVKAFINLFFSNLPYNLERFTSGDVKDFIVSHLKENTYDIIQVEGLYMCWYIPEIKKHSNALISFRAHNIESNIWFQNGKNSKGFKKLYFKLLGNRLLHFEKKMLEYYDAIIPITEKDADFYRSHFDSKKIHATPFGIAPNSLPETSKCDKQSIFFIGALDWLPNTDGLFWFIESVLPLLIEEYPELKLYIAGRNGAHELKEKLDNPNIIYLGEIENAYDFINNHSIMIVPLFSGSGMRVKIIEGMYMQKPIIATTLAAEGIEYTNEKDIFIADDAQTFYKNIKFLLENKDIKHSIGSNARKLVEDKYDNNKISKNLLDFYKNQLNDN